MKPSHRINAVRDGQSTYKLEFRDLIGEEDDGVYEITATNDEGNYHEWDTVQIEIEKNFGAEGIGKIVVFVFRNII